MRRKGSGKKWGLMVALVVLLLVCIPCSVAQAEAQELVIVLDETKSMYTESDVSGYRYDIIALLMVLGGEDVQVRVFPFAGTGLTYEEWGGTTTSDGFRELMRKLLSIQYGGGKKTAGSSIPTRAISDAFGALSESEAQRKHLIYFSDGGVSVNEKKNYVSKLDTLGHADASLWMFWFSSLAEEEKGNINKLYDKSFQNKWGPADAMNDDPKKEGMGQYPQELAYTKAGLEQMLSVIFTDASLDLVESTGIHDTYIRTNASIPNSLTRSVVLALPGVYDMGSIKVTAPDNAPLQGNVTVRTMQSANYCFVVLDRPGVWGDWEVEARTLDDRNRIEKQEYGKLTLDPKPVDTHKIGLIRLEEQRHLGWEIANNTIGKQEQITLRALWLDSDGKRLLGKDLYQAQDAPSFRIQREGQQDDGQLITMNVQEDGFVWVATPGEMNLSSGRYSVIVDTGEELIFLVTNQKAYLAEKVDYPVWVDDLPDGNDKVVAKDRRLDLTHLLKDGDSEKQPDIADAFSVQENAVTVSSEGTYLYVEQCVPAATSHPVILRLQDDEQAPSVATITIIANSLQQQMQEALQIDVRLTGSEGAVARYQEELTVTVEIVQVAESGWAGGSVEENEIYKRVVDLIRSKPIKVLWRAQAEDLYEPIPGVFSFVEQRAWEQEDGLFRMELTAQVPAAELGECIVRLCPWEGLERESQPVEIRPQVVEYIGGDEWVKEHQWTALSPLLGEKQIDFRSAFYLPEGQNYTWHEVSNSNRDVLDVDVQSQDGIVELNVFAKGESQYAIGATPEGMEWDEADDEYRVQTPEIPVYVWFDTMVFIVSILVILVIVILILYGLYYFFCHKYMRGLQVTTTLVDHRKEPAKSYASKTINLKGRKPIKLVDMVDEEQYLPGGDLEFYLEPMKGFVRPKCSCKNQLYVSKEAKAFCKDETFREGAKKVYRLDGGEEEKSLYFEYTYPAGRNRGVADTYTVIIGLILVIHKQK